MLATADTVVIPPYGMAARDLDAAVTHARAQMERLDAGAPPEVESSDLPIEGVAREVGFATAASLRQHLHTAVGVSPVAYRRTFRPEGLADGQAPTPPPPGRAAVR